MKLLIHAGSHKTATTSIQHFCAMNRDVLVKDGVYYPRNTSSSYVFNFLASDIAFGKAEKTKSFLEKAAKVALQKDCHTVLVSAESFYAMTGFFIDVQKQDRKHEDYFENERELIEAVKSCCSVYEQVDVVFYLRPQDDFAGSLYNQFVKNVFGISDNYNDCIKRIKCIFDYDAHMRLWEEIFGSRHIFVRNFLSCKTDPVAAFCNEFVGKGCYARARKKSFLSNTRLSRDVLEFKRVFNAQDHDRAMRYIAARCLAILSEKFPDQSGYQVYAPYEERQKFFGPFEKGNKALFARHGQENLPVLIKKTEPSYPGLPKEKHEEIDAALQKMLRQPRYKVMLDLRRWFNKIMDAVPGGACLLKPLRILVHRSRIVIEGW